MGEMVLDWEGHDKALSNKLWEFFKEEYLVDFNVTCHGHEKKVHKFVLACFFPMLKESLRSSDPFALDQKESARNDTVGIQLLPTPKCLNLDNIADHAEDMDYLIQFAYTGRTAVPKEHADCLMHIADTMGIKSLKDSLRKWNDKRKPKDKNESNDVAPLSRLRPRTQLKNIISESVDALRLLSTFTDEESSTSDILDSDECSEEDNEEIIRTRKKKTQQKSAKSPNSPKMLQMLLASVDSMDEVPLEGQTTTSTGDNIIENKTLKCHQCDFVAKWPSKLQRHLETHSRKLEKVQKGPKPKQFACDICNKDFGTERWLAKHRDTNSCTEHFVCKYCGHKARQKTTLQQHMISKHLVDADGNQLEKNVKCPDCDFVCCADYQLRAHQRSKHERVGKFKCKECNYSVPYIGQLLRHERRKHQNVRNYMCEECGYRFQVISHLKRHVLVKHKGLKPYKCHICSAEYSDSLSFKIHMQRHEGKVEYKFVCHICGHNLRRKYELKNHMKNKHDMELEETTNEPCQSQDACEPTST